MIVYNLHIWSPIISLIATSLVLKNDLEISNDRFGENPKEKIYLCEIEHTC